MSVGLKLFTVTDYDLSFILVELVIVICVGINTKNFFHIVMERLSSAIIQVINTLRLGLLMRVHFRSAI